MELSRLNKNPGNCHINPKYQPPLHRKRKDFISPKMKYDIRKGLGVEPQSKYILTL